MSDLLTILTSLKKETERTIEMLHFDMVQHLHACTEAIGSGDLVGVNVHGRLFTDRIKDLHEVVSTVATKLPVLIETLDPVKYARLNLEDVNAEIGWELFKHDHLHRTVDELEDDRKAHMRECTTPDCDVHEMYVRLMRERASLVH